MNRTFFRVAIEEENPFAKTDGVLFAAIVHHYRSAINWNFRRVTG